MLEDYCQDRIAEAAISAAHESCEPHVLMRPKVYPDGDQWCALYGEDIQSGVAGFGKTPALACQNFNDNWRTQLPNSQGRET